jgi:hypothetical protein
MPVAKKCSHLQEKKTNGTLEGGKKVHRDLYKGGSLASVFIATLLITTLNISFLPKAAALADMSIPTVIINPQKGNVGDVVRVTGEINTTDGPYLIFFDGEKVKNGTATGTVVNDTFIVPPRLMGNYTVTLHDLTIKSNYTSSEPFTVQTAYFVKAVVPSPPKQIQEGESTKILVNVAGGAENTRYLANVTVTDPSGAVFYNDILQLTNTTNTGYGEGNTIYPADFSFGAHTNYTGTYQIAFNETLATANFTVGLTSATEYHRFEVVNIRALNYTQPNECAWVNITFAGEPLGGFPKNVSAVNGVIQYGWEIPGNASMGTYTVTVTNSTTPGTVKLVLDTQNFTIVEIPFQVQTKKLNGEVLADVNVYVYEYVNGTLKYISKNKTDKEGLASLSVEGGNYTFRALWPIELQVLPIEIGNLLNQSVKETVTLTLWCWIAHMKIAVSPPLPFINVTLTYHNITSSFETNRTGIIETYNMPTNISYTIEARRYGFLFNTTNTTPEKLHVEKGVTWVNVTIICPTYTLFIHASDSKEHPIRNATVEVVEWGSGRIAGLGKTSEWGSVRLDCTFGRYKVRVYNYSEMLGQTVVLNETVVDVVRNQFYFVLHCKTMNLDLSVKAMDYFGQFIPNAVVNIEREGVEILDLPTGSYGNASIHGIIGGDYRISLYVAGRLYRVKSLCLNESTEIIFQVGDYVMVGGYPLASNQLITGISLTILLLCALALIYRRRLKES